MSECQDVREKYADNPLFQQVLKEGLAIQDRFSAEPVYARTGKGYLKSVGVSEIAEAKEQMRKAKNAKE
jgi:hypothetical protein